MSLILSAKRVQQVLPVLKVHKVFRETKAHKVQKGTMQKDSASLL
ncbi:hypothetical protein pzkkv7_148 [Klebsiella phage pzk-kv7]|nr:hypothetical protein pzkkv7_148 [Klebsiella phage pzk-kv7]